MRLDVIFANLEAKRCGIDVDVLNSGRGMNKRSQRNSEWIPMKVVTIGSSKEAKPRIINAGAAVDFAESLQ